MKNKYLYGEDVVHAYPNGWSCVSCGTDFNKETINVECLYVIQTKEGVECLKCVNENDVQTSNKERKKYDNKRTRKRNQRKNNSP